MQRRDFIRGVVIAAVAPQVFLGQAGAPARPPAPPAAAPVPWMQGLNPATPLPATQSAETVAATELKFFTPVQMETLTRLSDTLFPTTSTRAGAIAAGTPAFLDFLIGASLQNRKAMYQEGLDWLEAESKNQYKRPFAKLEPAQVDHLVKPWLRTWMSDHLPTESYAAFVNTAHRDIRSATLNSKVWAQQNEASAGPVRGRSSKGLYWSPVEPDMYWDHAAETLPHMITAR